MTPRLLARPGTPRVAVHVGESPRGLPTVLAPPGPGLRPGFVVAARAAPSALRPSPGSPAQASGLGAGRARARLPPRGPLPPQARWFSSCRRAGPGAPGCGGGSPYSWTEAAPPRPRAPGRSRFLRARPVASTPRCSRSPCGPRPSGRQSVIWEREEEGARGAPRPLPPRHASARSKTKTLELDRLQCLRCPGCNYSAAGLRGAAAAACSRSVGGSLSGCPAATSCPWPTRPRA